MARDRLWIRRISARLEGGNSRPRETFPRKAGVAQGEAIRGGGQFLLELRDVFLALRYAARPTAAASSQDRDHLGRAAGFRFTQLPAETRSGISVVRKHLHR